MFFRRFYDDQLAQASYLLGCQATGEALVVDPNRQVDPYLRTAAGGGAAGHARHRDPHPRRLRVGRPRAGRADRRAAAPLGRGWPRLAIRVRGAERRRAASTTATGFEVGRLQILGPAHAGAHAGASHLPGHRYRRGHRADGRAHRRFHLRRRRGTPRSAGARGAPRRNDGGRRPAALPLAPAVRDAARLPADLARPRRRLRLRQGPRRGAAVHPGLRAAVQLGVPASTTRTSSFARCWPGSPIRPGTSPR